jgi:PAS domain S-box-containing protein
MLKFLCLFIASCLLSLSTDAMQVIAEDDNPAKERAAKYYAKATQLGVSEADASLYADSLAHLASILNDAAVWYNTYKLKGDIALGQHNYNQSVYWFKNAIRQAGEYQDTLSLVRVMHNLGLAYYHTAKYDKALESLSQAQVLGRKYLDAYQQATVMDNLGLVYSELGQYEDALAYFKNALELFGEKELKGKAIVYSNIGTLYRKNDQRDKALEHLRQARKLYEEVGDDEGIARVLNELALVYLKESPEISVEYLRLTKKLYVKNKNKVGLYQLNKHAGQAYATLGDYEHALIHYTQALNYADSLQNTHFKGDVFLKLANLYELQDNFSEAAAYYKNYIAVEKDFYNQELANNLASTKESYEIGQKESLIRDLEEKATLTSSQLRYRNISLILMVFLSLLAIFLTVIFIRKFRGAAKTNKLLQARHQLILSQKEEISEQRDLIERKNAELNKAHQINEENNQQLLAAKEELEEKVKKRTRELEDTYRKLAFHINNTPLAVLEWNSRQELIHWPGQAEGIFGYTADEMLGLRIDEVPFLLPEDRKEMQDTIAQLSSGELARQYFTKLNIDRSGKRKYVEWSYSVLLNQEGALESVLTIANDVSMREQAYRALKATNKELDTFLYKSSHDLRGPIARMQGIINLGLLETTDATAHTYFNMLSRVTEEFNTLLLRLLMVHNINQHEFSIEDIPFHHFVDAIIKEYGTKSQSFNPVNIVNKIPADLVLKADPGLLNIALINLLENSLLFSDNFNPYVEFDAIYLPSGKYILTVADNGMGIPLHYQEKIFDMFFQGSTRSTGTGLGLYMVRKAIKRLGGDIRLLSENGHTIFEITLPAAKNHEFAGVQLIN